MSTTIDNIPGLRPARPVRSRSQRVVQIVQKSRGDDLVSVVTMDQSGPSRHMEESVDLRDLQCTDSVQDVEIAHDFVTDADDAIDGNQTLNVPVAASRDQDSSPVFFDAATDDGSVYSFYDADDDDHEAEAATSDLFSDDEFEPICMNFSKRPSLPFVLPARIDIHANKSLPPTPRSLVSHIDRNGFEESTYADDSESISCTTLYSLASTASSATCVTQTQYAAKIDGRPFCSYDKVASSKLLDIVTPETATGTRGLVDLQNLGYDFSWSRFTPRSEGAHGLKPEDSADLEVFLSRGPNAFPTPGPCRPKLRGKKSNLEKKILGVFKKRVA